ncbi:hypothetical protein TRAPUB_12643 [Trametes pubescens]|uniref:Uncharacterized protein n=1 Tax=Trametes pubescens TaxID=154538 RepID=A0A1M2VT90_TRAPU|nr:hypothetical protein TRAPUB_12643 [Trametes pubescens]
MDDVLHPSFQDTVFDGEHLLGIHNTPISLTTGHTRDQQDFNRVMGEMSSIPFLTGLGGVTVGAGDTDNAPAVEGIDWSDDEEQQENESQLAKSLSLVAGMLNAMELDTAPREDEDEDQDEEFMEGDEEEYESMRALPDPTSAWYPYPNKLTFLLASLVNRPRMRLSKAQVGAILWLLRQLGHQDAPSVKMFYTIQEHVRQVTVLPTVQMFTPTGKVFCRNRIPDLIRMDWANPVTRQHIEEYPIRSASVSEAYQAHKRTSLIPPEVVAPMWANGGKHYFVGELAQLATGQYAFPRCWFRRESRGEVLADAWLVKHYPATDVYVIEDPDTVEIKSTELDRNICDILGDTALDLLNVGGQLPEGIYNGVNPLRKVARGKRMYTSFIKLWGDDVSGNRSKQYNAHTNVYFTHANLPHQKLAQQYHVKFSSTSQFASSGDQFDAAMADISGDNLWHDAYDCSAREDIMLRIIPEVLPADNPQQSASCSHVGLHGNHPCRRCEFGGTELERETDEGYETHFSPGTPRTAAQTLSAIRAQLRAAALGVAKTVAEMQTISGVKDPLAEYWIQRLIPLAREKQQVRIRNPGTRDPRLHPRRVLNRAAIIAEIEAEIQDELMQWLITQPDKNYESLPPNSPQCLELRASIHFNSLLCADTLDVHRDTPVELLHTYLLGVEKYSWYYLHNEWTDPQSDLFAARLQSSSLDGLTLPALRASWMLQHPNNLIGKHLKALQQLTVFHLDDSLCAPITFDLIKATGELGALLWFHEIEDMKVYQEDLTILIGNLLDIWARIDPQRVFVKLKLHILLHILEDVHTHGPGILNSTEVFEAFNAVFRGSSIFSNHLAPSRDIANSSAILESYKHVVSGGWWTSEDGLHLRAGYKVRQYFSDPQVTRQLGLEEQEDKPEHKEVATLLRAAHDSRRKKDAAARRARKDKAEAEKTQSATGPVMSAEPPTVAATSTVPVGVAPVVCANPRGAVTHTGEPCGAAQPEQMAVANLNGQASSGVRVLTT